MSVIKQFLLSLVVVAAGIAGWIYFVPSSVPWLEEVGLFDLLGIEPPAAAAAERSGPPRADPSVIVAPVKLLQQSDRVGAIGDGRALHSVTLRSDVPGRISAVEVDSGQYVKAGDVLIRLEDSVERIAVERAKLMRADAQTELERVNRLTGTGAVTAVRQQEAELALQTADLELRQAEFELDQKVIVAPFSGWAGLIELDEGDRVLAQDSVTVITDRSRILVDFRVPERVVGQITVGMPFFAEPLAHRGMVLKGQVSAIDNLVERSSRTLRVQGTLDNREDLLRSGMAFSVSMEFPGVDTPAVPPLSVQWSSDGAFVWAVTDGIARQVPVRIMQRNADAVLVQGDLPEGTLVVVEGVQTLRPGARVTIVSELSARPEVAEQQRIKL